jgi:predicted nucleotide-binding protein (sugar kinase/HSP70/actin superfamily)
MRIISRIKKLEEFFTDFGKEQDVLLLQGKSAKSKNYFLSAFCDENEKKFFEEKKDIRDNTGSINYYKDMIRVRKRTEKNMQEELYKLAEKIHVAKKEKEEAENKGFELAKELKEIYIKETNILKEIKVNKKTSDKNHKKINLNSLYNNESEDEKKLIRNLSEEEQNYNNFNPNPRDRKMSSNEDYFNFSSEKKKLYFYVLNFFYQYI